MNEERLEVLLRALARDVVYPQAPDMTRAVTMRIAAPARRAPFRLAFRVALAVAVLLAILLAIPPVRTGLAELLGLRGLTLFYTPRDLSGQAGRLNLGNPVTLADAERHAGPLRVPALGTPDEVFLNPSPIGRQIWFVYHARADLPPIPSLSAGPGDAKIGLLVSQVRVNLDRGLFQKGFGAGTALEQVQIGSETGYWLNGSPRVFLVRLSDGTVVEEQVRLAGNTLLWQRGDVTLRIEGAIDRSTAIRIAEGMR